MIRTRLTLLAAAAAASGFAVLAPAQESGAPDGADDGSGDGGS